MGRHKLTPWFAGIVKPTRPGVYEAETHKGAKVRLYFGEGVWRKGADPADEYAPYGVSAWRGEAQPRNGTPVLDDDRLD